MDVLHSEKTLLNDDCSVLYARVNNYGHLKVGMVIDSMMWEGRDPTSTRLPK